MQNTKFIQLLKSLKAAEFKQFRRYLQRPFFTQSADVLKLYDYIRKYYPDFDDAKLDRKIAYKKVFPKQTYNQARFDNLLYKLKKIIENYLIYLKFHQDDYQKKKLLTQIYGERNLNVIFKKNTEELLTELERRPYRDSQYFYDSYFLQREYYFHIHTSKSKEDALNLNTTLKKLQTFQAIERLRVGLELKNRERIFGENYNFDIDSPFESDNIIYKIYKQLFLLYETNETVFFLKAKQLFLSNINKIYLSVDAVVFIRILINFALLRIPLEGKKYSEISLTLYEIGLERKLLLTNGILRHIGFLNIVTLSAKLKTPAYAKKIILNYQPFLAEDIRTELSLLATSFIHFYQQQNEQAIKILQSIRFSDLLLKITAKVLLIRCHYHLFEKDTTYFNVVISGCSALENSLKRSSNLSKSKNEEYFNFLYFLKKITHQKVSKATSPKEKLDLLLLLKERKVVGGRSWLEEIIQRL